ncbi:hypothetical protein PN398_08015 [Romboutsia sp. 1001216sp1]|nr:MULTISPECIES: hypothetical protein [unclassified Romboutsia]MDB8790664.1 hypothetical protein [Romboutsia sp. 1001216sp1]MDB8803283.1 hypothetical protein [Romboutsia sp. 1001216sp1]MDB8814609.1 hypothetical protein [Romboutsia sp. 1001216sp1]
MAEKEVIDLKKEIKKLIKDINEIKKLEYIYFTIKGINKSSC